MVTTTRPSDPEIRVLPARRPASEPEPARPAHIAAGFTSGLAAHVGCQWALWAPDGPSFVYGLIGLTQIAYLGPLVALMWKWPRGWRVGLLGSAIMALLLNASMLHLFLVR